jgi:primosomal replication protein N
MISCAYAYAQSLPVKGSAATLDVGTWNILLFGNDGQPPEDATQIANVAEIIRQSGIDLWSIQEVEDAADFDLLVDALGEGWAGELDVSSSNLRVAYIYKTDVIEVRRISNILTQYSSEFAGRRPLQIEAEVTLPDTTFTAIFIALHMKCCGDAQSWQRRQEASNQLKIHLDTFFADMPVFVLGDFNDELTNSISSGHPSPFAGFISDTQAYRFTTQRLDIDGKNTYCSTNACTSGSTIDHILITDELFDAYIAGSTDTYDEVLNSQNGIPAYKSSTSDHLPVFARFHFSEVTGTESHPEDDVRIDTIFPNPIYHTAKVEYTVPGTGHISIRIFDVLGRTRHTIEDQLMSAGSHTLHLHNIALPSGAYVLHLQTERRTLVKPFTVLR